MAGKVQLTQQNTNALMCIMGCTVAQRATSPYLEALELASFLCEDARIVHWGQQRQAILQADLQMIKCLRHSHYAAPRRERSCNLPA